MFFDGNSYTYFSSLKDLRIPTLILQKNKVVNKIYFNSNFALSSSLSITISILTLIILLFMFMPNETLHLSNLLAIVLFIPVNI